MKLKGTKKTIFEVDSDNFDRFVEHHYGGSFEVIAIQELNNGSMLTIPVPNAAVSFSTDNEEIRRGDYPMYSAFKIVNCLYEDGHLEEGELSIKVSW